MLLYRVASKFGPPRWMASTGIYDPKTTPYSDQHAVRKLRLIKSSDLLEKDPCEWKKKARREPLLDNKEEDIHYTQLLAPIPRFPPMVYGLGLNYASHSAETKMEVPKLPIVIGKSPTSLVGPFDPIRIPNVCPELEVDFEVELAIVIGKQCKDVSKEKAMDAVLGFSCANDVSARKWQGKKGGGQWTRAKSFDTFMPVGPGILLESNEVKPQNMSLRSYVSSNQSDKADLMQDANTRDMIFGVSTLIEFLSQDTTLHPWTVILTGTPAGVGYTRNPPVYLQSGGRVTVEIDGIGALYNTVSSASSERNSR